jgi:hypothetical protein
MIDDLSCVLACACAPGCGYVSDKCCAAKVCPPAKWRITGDGAVDVHGTCTEGCTVSRAYRAYLPDFRVFIYRTRAIRMGMIGMKSASTHCVHRKHQDLPRNRQKPATTSSPPSLSQTQLPPYAARRLSLPQPWSSIVIVESRHCNSVTPSIRTQGTLRDTRMAQQSGQAAPEVHDMFCFTYSNISMPSRTGKYRWLYLTKSSQASRLGCFG